MGDGAHAIVKEFMSVPVVLRPEATKDTEEAIGYFDALRPGLGQTFLIQVRGVCFGFQGCPRFMEWSGEMYVLRDCGGSPMLFITVSTKIVWRCWP